MSEEYCNGRRHKSHPKSDPSDQGGINREAAVIGHELELDQRHEGLEKQGGTNHAQAEYC